MRSFLKYVLASMVGIALIICVFFLIVIGIISAGNSTDEISHGAILKIELNTEIKEVARVFSIAGITPFSGLSTIGITELSQTIKKAKNDDRIKGIYLEPGSVSCGFGILEEVKDVLKDFRTSGKFIVAYGEYYNEKGYYLASIADSIYLNPQGLVEFNGLVQESTFYKNMLDKLGVEPEVFKVGTFKSAVEPVLADKMSPASIEQVKSYLNSIYDNYLAQLSSHIGVDSAKLARLSNQMLIRKAEDAISRGFITNTAYPDQVQASLKALVDENKLTFVDYDTYKNARANKPAAASKNKIAVLITEGIIASSGDDSYIRSDALVKQLRKIRDNSHYKALVLRINSPGGSLLASDVIWREVQLTKEKMPVVASMSDLAASGGYYMAMGCDKIVAYPTTITGSIGIFAMFFSVEKFLAEKIGITFDEVQTGEIANIGNSTHTFTRLEREIIQQSIDEGYETFTTKAAQGRNMEVSHLKTLAEGRVWSGKQALQIGLVDRLGNMQDAIALAAELAQVGDDYSVNYLNKHVNVAESIFSGSGLAVAQEALLQLESKALYNLYRELKYLQSLNGVQAMLPYKVEIH